MHPFFSVTLFTGQQLVLEALQRWLQRPCPDAAAVQRRHRGLKQLIGLLLRTAATGVLATVLDAAIEFRRRQLLAAAAEDPADGGGAASAGGLFPGLGMLSRAGVAAWKSRLVLAIDELERRAGEYGIESRHRFGPGKGGEEEAAAGSSAGKAPALPCHPAVSCLDLAAGCSEEEEARSLRLGRTVEQLQQLVKQNDPESQRRLDSEMGSLVDLILGTAPPPSTATPGAAAARARSYSVPAALDRLAGGAVRAGGAARQERCVQGGTQPGSPTGSSGGGSGFDAELCAICMDRCVSVRVSGCCHDLCFGCARRLCAQQDHQVPQCPFCRQAIEGFSPLAVPRCAASASASAASARAAVRA
ncbi:E3 ubiquitin-ligase XBAT31 [Micractinium conductrix]|uniref:E3 ubiquitin-ligase XBAT31 n=1 Tax=Micractinium conductrix TaxID=554055 RepID=A0A2P6VF24_9CHLO|nr:E3 ubiquitin-ligase XBAT31 [Micractinium conductrix]|eukprot:PSC72690.1 E3 ubiquitin-ligase XBAT31 [Micractinium conductrix]